VIRPEVNDILIVFDGERLIGFDLVDGHVAEVLCFSCFCRPSYGD
jgi:hypothetical protein